MPGRSAEAANGNEFSRLASYCGLASSTGLSPAAVARPVRRVGTALLAALCALEHSLLSELTLVGAIAQACLYCAGPEHRAGSRSDSWAGSNTPLLLTHIGLH